MLSLKIALLLLPLAVTAQRVVRFIADDEGALIGAMGMLFDASTLLGGPRSKVIVRRNWLRVVLF